MIFGPSSYVKIAFCMTECDIQPDLSDKIGIRMSKCDIRPEFECQKQNLECQNAIFGSNSKVKHRISNVNLK